MGKYILSKNFFVFIDITLNNWKYLVPTSTIFPKAYLMIFHKSLLQHTTDLKGSDWYKNIIIYADHVVIFFVRISIPSIKDTLGSNQEVGST